MSTLLNKSATEDAEKYFSRGSGETRCVERGDTDDSYHEDGGDLLRVEIRRRLKHRSKFFHGAFLKIQRRPANSQSCPPHSARQNAKLSYALSRQPEAIAACVFAQYCFIYLFIYFVGLGLSLIHI